MADNSPNEFNTTIINDNGGGSTNLCLAPKRFKIVMNDSHSEGSFIINGEKRPREEQPPHNNSMPNTPNSSNSSFRLLQIMDKKIEKNNTTLQSSLDEIKNMIRESEIRVLADIEIKINGMKSEMNCLRERLIKVEKAAEDIHSLKSEIKDLKLKSLKQENALVACDLRINGIPYERNENLLAILNCLCDVIKTPMPTFKNIYRLQNRNNTKKQNSPDGVIIAKFLSPYDKNFFMKNLNQFKKATKANLTLNHIGLGSANQIYINENLSNTNYKILQEAIQLKKRKYIVSAYTFRGLVFVKQTSTDEPHCIEDIEILKLFRGPENFASNNVIID